MKSVWSMEVILIYLLKEWTLGLADGDSESEFLMLSGFHSNRHAWCLFDYQMMAQPASVHLKAELFFQEIVSFVWVLFVCFLQQSHCASQAGLELTM